MSLPLAPPCPTASKLALAFACPASVLLQQGVPDEPSPDAEWGRLVHIGAEHLANDQSLDDAIDLAYIGIGSQAGTPLIPRRGALQRTLEHVRARLVEDWESAIDATLAPKPERGDWHVEPGYAYHLRTGAVRGPFTREPGASGEAWEVCGSADLVFRRVDQKLVVADWKPDMGKTARVGSTAADHHQLYFLALCASRVHGAPAGVCVELRYYSEEGVRIDGATLDEADLALFEADLLALARRLAEYPAPVPGWHCEGMHCRARATCPATTALAERAVNAVRPLPAELLRRVAETPEEAAQQYEALRVLRGVEGVLEEHVKAHALARGSIPVAPGIELVARTVRGRDEVNDTPEGLAAAALELDYGVEYWARYTATKAMILDAWAQKTGKRKNSADGRRFVERLRERGVLRQSAPSIRLEERRAGAVDTTGEEVDS